MLYMLRWTQGKLLLLDISRLHLNGNISESGCHSVLLFHNWLWHFYCCACTKEICVAKAWLMTKYNGEYGVGMVHLWALYYKPRAFHEYICNNNTNFSFTATTAWWAHRYDLTNSTQQAHGVSCKLTESSQQAYSVNHLVRSLWDNWVSSKWAHREIQCELPVSSTDTNDVN